MGAALPPASEASKRHGLDANATSAYNVCLDFEASAKDSPSDLIRARILGYLILYSPSTMAQHEFVKVIHSCGFKKESLSVLGTTFLDYYIRPFKKFKGRTPKGSSHPSRLSFDKTKEELLAGIDEAPKHFPEAKRRALIRDGYRCVVTRKYDFRVTSVPYLDVTNKDIFVNGGGLYTVCPYCAKFYLFNDVHKLG